MMRYRTVPEAVVELNAEGRKVSEIGLRRLIASGDIPYLEIGTRKLVDLDVITPIIEVMQRDGVGIARVCELTGLSDSAIRLGVREGWIPHWTFGRAYMFDPDEVTAALMARLQGGGAEG